MEISIATLEDLQKVKEEIIEALSAKIDNDILHIRDNEYLTVEETCKILDVCSKQLKKYRDDRRISYSKFGRKVYFKRKDIDEFLEEYKVKKKKWL